MGRGGGAQGNSTPSLCRVREFSTTARLKTVRCTGQSYAHHCVYMSVIDGTGGETYY